LAEVPIVGQKAKLLHWWPSALVRCQHDTNMAIIVLHGLQNLTVCSECRTGYLIEGLLPDGQLGIRVILPGSSSTVQ
jgi:hypothetical protein